MSAYRELEGECQVNSKNNDKRELVELNDDASTFDPHHATGEPQEHDEEMVQFLEEHDLMDMKQEILASKLKLSHFKEIEKKDLDDLCNDFELKPSQTIRLKHAIKALQRSIVRERLRKKMKCKVLSSADQLRAFQQKGMQKLKRSESSNMSSRLRRKYNQRKAAVPEEQKANLGEEEVDNVRNLRSKIVIVGEAAVGKTTLQKAMMGWKFENGSKPTFAVSSCHHKSSYKYKQYDMKVDYEIFDTPGLDRFADIITLYLRGALALIVVYDVCKPSSLCKAKWWIEFVENNASGYDKIILIANKIDIKEQLVHPSDGEQDEQDEDDEDDEDEAEEDGSTAGKEDDAAQCDIIKEGRLYATERGISFLELSAKTNANVCVLLSWLNKQSKKKVARNPQLVAKKDQAIQLHEGLLNANNPNRGNLMQKLEDFDYSKCCAW